MSESNIEQVVLKLNRATLALIDKSVEMGVANDRADFIRQSISKLLQELGLFSLLTERGIVHVGQEGARLHREDTLSTESFPKDLSLPPAQSPSSAREVSKKQQRAQLSLRDMLKKAMEELEAYSRWFNQWEVIEKVQSMYSDLKKGSIRAHIAAYSVNHTSRKHYATRPNERFILYDEVTSKIKLLTPEDQELLALARENKLRIVEKDYFTLVEIRVALERGENSISLSNLSETERLLTTSIISELNPTYEDMPNWQLIKIAAELLTTQSGGRPFTRKEIYDCINNELLQESPQKRNIDSINPCIQGVTVNAPGGAPGCVGKKILYRISRGKYVLYDPDIHVG